MVAWTGEGVSSLAGDVEVIAVGGDVGIAVGIRDDVLFDVGLGVGADSVGSSLVGAMVDRTGSGRSGLATGVEVIPVGGSNEIVVIVGGIGGDGLDVGI